MGLDSPHEGIFTAEWIPHGYLFPRVSAVVHHGGAGTTAACLRAGVPSVVLPSFADQAFWGRRVTELGVAPATLSASRLSVRALSRAIRAAATSGAMRRRAAELGRRVRAEDGVGQAVAAIERRLQVAC
jgi:UDP:flavonoid glycosyltransferase YjiC (YdhE family)